MSSSDNILKLASSYCDKCINHLTKVALIRKLPDVKCRAASAKGDSRADNKTIDLTGLDEFSFSSLMRELRKKATKEQCNFFLKTHKLYFDKAVRDEIKNPEKIALKMAFVNNLLLYNLCLKCYSPPYNNQHCELILN